MLSPTTLTHERQIKLRADFDTFLKAAGDTTPYQIEFRAMKGQGANAFALPSGTIVISDELVLLAEDDREIVAVLAHECAHVRHRHVLRAVLQNSAGRRGVCARDRRRLLDRGLRRRSPDLAAAKAVSRASSSARPTPKPW